MYCKNCSAPLPAGATFCTSCGAPANAGENFCPNCGQASSPSDNVCGRCGFMLRQGMPIYVPQKSRLVAGLLGIFIGTLGIHNFYLGYTNKGITQLLLSTVGGGTNLRYRLRRGMDLVINRVYPNFHRFNSN